jgi:hypothetical protein
MLPSTATIVYMFIIEVRVTDRDGYGSRSHSALSLPLAQILWHQHVLDTVFQIRTWSNLFKLALSTYQSENCRAMTTKLVTLL